MPPDPDPLEDLDALFPPVPPEGPTMPGWYRAPKGRSRAQRATLLVEVEIAAEGEGLRAASELRQAGFGHCHLRTDLEHIDPGGMGAEIERLRSEGVWARALSVAPNALDAGAVRGGAIAEPELLELLAVLGDLEAPARPLVVVPSGWGPGGERRGTCIQPRERGEAQRALVRWSRAAARGGVGLAIEPDAAQVLHSVRAAERFIEAHGGRNTGLALAPRRLLAGEQELAPGLLAMLLRLAPWSRLLYVEGGAAWPDAAGAPEIDARLLARSLRAAGVPPLLTLRGLAARDWSAARDEVLEGFGSLGLPLDGG